jgi:Flp pilus assembly protein TadG
VIGTASRPAVAGRRARAPSVHAADRGSAVVAFALVVVPLAVLVLATVQAVAYLRLRDLVAAAAEQGARAGAAAGASTRDGGAVADAVLDRSLPAAVRGAIRCAGTGDGTALVVVRCRGTVPGILARPDLPIRVGAHAVREGR